MNNSAMPRRRDLTPNPCKPLLQREFIIIGRNERSRAGGQGRDQPRHPNAMTCCFLSSSKTLAMPSEGTGPHTGVNVPEDVSVGRFSSDHGWPVLGDRRGGHFSLAPKPRYGYPISGAPRECGVSPERIGCRHLTDQGSNLRTGLGATATLPSRDPGPEEPETLAMPRHHCLRSDDDQGSAPVLLGPGEA